jgi:O-methyltransferase involved in polyketide biosynthesis
MSAAAELGGVSETLLIPLAARALGARAGQPDPTAERLCRVLDVDLTRYGTSPSTNKGVLARGAWFDAQCIALLQRYDDPLFVSLGSGLNTMYERMAARAGGRRFGWVDSDLPDVVTLRKTLLPDNAQRRTIALDLRDSDWFDTLGWRAGRPLVFAAEGVLMYLEAPMVRALFQTVARRCRAGCSAHFLFDWASPLMVKRSRRHPAVRRTKDKSIVFRWGARRASDIETFDRRWRVKRQYDLMLHSGAGPAAFSIAHRLLTGRRFYGCAHAALGER